MVGEIPVVLVESDSTNGVLKLRDGEIVAVGTDRWFDWLRAQESFRFVSGGLSFTARKHERYAGQFWYGYRKVNGKLKNAYLGKPDNLTMDKLLSVALKLSGAPKLGANEISKGDSDLTPSKVQLGNGYALDCITPEVMQQMKEETATLTADNEQLRSLLRQAQEQIDSLKAEAENLQVERQQVQEVLKEILENNKNKLKGYLSNAFGQGIKDIRNLLHSTWE